MYKLCKTEQSAARQRQLEEGLLLSMQTRQYEEISVSELCNHIGIPRKSFYRYFTGKDGALHALLDHTLLRFEFLGTELTEHPINYQNELERFFQFWLQQKPLLDAMQKSGLSGVLIERAISHAVSEVTTCRHRSQDEKLARNRAVMFGTCGLMSMMMEWHHAGYDMTPRQMAKIAVRLLTEPLFSIHEP